MCEILLCPPPCDRVATAAEGFAVCVCACVCSNGGSSCVSCGMKSLELTYE